MVIWWWSVSRIPPKQVAQPQSCSWGRCGAWHAVFSAATTCARWNLCIPSVRRATDAMWNQIPSQQAVWAPVLDWLLWKSPNPTRVLRTVQRQRTSGGQDVVAFENDPPSQMYSHREAANTFQAVIHASPPKKTHLNTPAPTRTAHKAVLTTTSHFWRR